MSSGDLAQRAHEAAAAACPSLVSVRIVGTTATVCDYGADATAPQRAAADAALAALDTSDAATAAWRTAKQRALAAADYDAQAQALLRAVVLVVLDEINALRSRASLADRTPAQVKAAILAKLAAGAAD